jgi:hypothetical protein
MAAHGSRWLLVLSAAAIARMAQGQSNSDYDLLPWHPVRAAARALG